MQNLRAGSFIKFPVKNKGNYFAFVLKVGNSLSTVFMVDPECTDPAKRYRVGNKKIDSAIEVFLEKDLRMIPYALLECWYYKRRCRRDNSESIINNLTHVMIEFNEEIKRRQSLVLHIIRGESKDFREAAKRHARQELNKQLKNAQIAQASKSQTMSFYNQPITWGTTYVTSTATSTWAYK